MTRIWPRARFLSATTVVAACAFTLTAFAFSQIPPARPPTARIEVDDDCTTLAYAPDGRLAYSTRHIFNLQKYQLERDDVWILEKDGRRRKIINGEKMGHGAGAFSYTITRLRWSPDSSKLSAQLATSQFAPTGDAVEGQLLFLFAQDGHEIKIMEGDSVIPGALDGAWLGNGDLVVYLTETVRPKLMFSLSTLTSAGSRVGSLFDKRPFAAVAWNGSGEAVAIEQNAADSAQPRLVSLNLLHEDHRALVTLDGYLGELSISPSGAKTAYFSDIDTLEIRPIEHPDLVSRIHVDYGPIAWSADESRILLKRGLQRQDGDLVWVAIPAPGPDPMAGEALPSSDGQPAASPESAPVPVLDSEEVRDFALSRDGHSLAVIVAGKHMLQVFDMP
jgi:dipeptidyl aminopeptidase/acylaminoacyl peptidase